MKRFWIENSIYDDGWLKKISGNQLKVLLAITRHYNKQGKCFPSIRKLEVNIGLHHATIKQCLNQLQLLGFLEQLQIREREKLRYIFSKTAHEIFIEPNKLLVKHDTKEIIKENYKEDLSKNINHSNQTEERDYGKIGGILDRMRHNLESRGIINKTEQ